MVGNVSSSVSNDSSYVSVNGSTGSTTGTTDSGVSFADLLYKQLAAQTQGASATAQPQTPLSGTVISDFEKLLSDMGVAPDRAQAMVSQLQNPTQTHHHGHGHHKKINLDQEMAQLLQQLNQDTSNTDATTSATRPGIPPIVADNSTATAGTQGLV